MEYSGDTDRALPQPLSRSLAETARQVEAYLADALNPDTTEATPPRLLEAMRHAVLGGGKRFRPLLVLETSRLFDVPTSDAMHAAAAIELIHCYSLVHDDLPAMDNDELRRGRPTVWKAYDEWTAILVGDALLTMAFEILSKPENLTDPFIRASAVAALARASGSAGMVGGQMLDLEAGKRGEPAAPTATHIANLQAMKTGRLIAVACELGAILGSAAPDARQALKVYGDNLGFAFQISDDLLDAEGSVVLVGKATGKDQRDGKATLVALLGVDEARRRLEAAITAARAALLPFGAAAQTLIEAAEFMGRRES